MADATAPFRDVMPLPGGPRGGSPSSTHAEGVTVNDRPSQRLPASSPRPSERTGAGAQSWTGSAAPLAPGPRLIGGGDLELLGELARGGMGAVYRALDRRLGREVAVKVMLGGGADPEERERFEIEARVGAAQASEHRRDLPRGRGAGDPLHRHGPRAGRVAPGAARSRRAAAADASRAVELHPSDVSTVEALVPTLVRLGQVEVARSLLDGAVPRSAHEHRWLDRARADLRGR